MIAPQTNTPATVCPACGESVTTALREAFDDRYGYPDLFRIVAFAGSGHQMTDPRLRESEMRALYGSYYPRKQILAWVVVAQARGASRRRNAFVPWLWGTGNQGQYDARRGERVLDVGCGSGVSLLEAAELGAQAYGIETDPNIQPIASELGLRIHPGSVHDNPFPGIVFDLVVVNQVTEHIPEHDRALLELGTRLAPGGRMSLVLPDRRSLWSRIAGPRWINWHLPYHLHHFDAATFRRMAERCGFRIVRVRPITPNLWTVLQLRAMHIEPVRGIASPMWQVPVERSGETRSRPARRPLKAILSVLALTLIAVFNRLVDAMGAGDSLMVELQPVRHA